MSALTTDLHISDTAPAAPAEADIAPSARLDKNGRRNAFVPGIGNTPLIQLDRVGAELPTSVGLYAKAEHLNPGGSVKDRAARALIRSGFDVGELPGRILIDATSGNTGIAYAMIGARLGLRVLLAIPENASPERMRILRAYGADLILTDPMEGTDGARREVSRFIENDPDRYFHPDQYGNPANWMAHFRTTGAEILEQTGGGVTHFVAGLGTTGTFVGISRRLNLADRHVACLAVQPDSPLHGLEGMKHLPSCDVPAIYDPDVADGQLAVSTEDAHEMTRRLSREEGLLVGPSSGANVAAALRVARKLESGIVVTILCDTGTRYLSNPLWTEAT